MNTPAFISKLTAHVDGTPRPALQTENDTVSNFVLFLHFLIRTITFPASAVSRVSRDRNFILLDEMTQGTVSALDQNPELNTEHLRIEVHPSGYFCMWFEGLVEKLSDHQQEMMPDGEMTHLSISYIYFLL